jgi:hypothetical protein
MHQGGGIAIPIKQALQDPAHRQLQTQVLDRGLLKKSANGL